MVYSEVYAVQVRYQGRNPWDAKQAMKTVKTSPYQSILPNEVSAICTANLYLLTVWAGQMIRSVKRRSATSNVISAKLVLSVGVFHWSVTS